MAGLMGENWLEGLLRLVFEGFGWVLIVRSTHSYRLRGKLICLVKVKSNVI
nr:MAG TPA_asm: hypothetical protein [Caudoviricetes sp.]